MSDIKRRKVMVSQYRSITKNGKKYWDPVEIGEAIFHEWGCDYTEFESGPGNYSTAIIEFDDGSIENIEVKLIKFIK